MQTALIALLRFYKLAAPCSATVAAFIPPVPTTRATQSSIMAPRGTYLAARRLCRYHPFSAGGVDLVPRPEGHDVPDDASTAHAQSSDCACDKLSKPHGASALSDRH